MKVEAAERFRTYTYLLSIIVLSCSHMVCFFGRPITSLESGSGIVIALVGLYYYLLPTEPPNRCKRCNRGGIR
jgi:hypothetical protein